MSQSVSIRELRGRGYLSLLQEFLRLKRSAGELPAWGGVRAGVREAPATRFLRLP